MSIARYEFYDNIGSMYELCSYYDGGFIMNELCSYISCMTFIMIPTSNRDLCQWISKFRFLSIFILKAWTAEMQLFPRRQ